MVMRRSSLSVSKASDSHQLRCRQTSVVKVLYQKGRPHQVLILPSRASIRSIQFPSKVEITCTLAQHYSGVFSAASFIYCALASPATDAEKEEEKGLRGSRIQCRQALLAHHHFQRPPAIFKIQARGRQKRGEFSRRQNPWRHRAWLLRHPPTKLSLRERK